MAAVGLRSDGDLAADSSCGSHEAYAEIHRRYYARLVRLCRGRIGDPVLAEDIAQTTMLRAIGAMDSFDHGRPLWPWLRVIALRLCASAAESRVREMPFEVADDMLSPVCDPSQQLVDRLSLCSALQGLPLRQRQALSLRYIEDVDGDEAASIIGINRNAFDQLLARGRSSLAAAFCGDNAVRGFGLFGGLALLRRIGRRGTDATSSSVTAAGPLFGAAALAAAATAAAVLHLQIGIGQLGQDEAPQLQLVVVRSAPAVVVSSSSSPAAAVKPAAPPAPPLVKVSTKPLEVSVAKSPFAAGSSSKAHVSLHTPLGHLDAGGGVAVGSEDATVCTVKLSAPGFSPC